MPNAKKRRCRDCGSSTGNLSRKQCYACEHQDQRHLDRLKRERAVKWVQC